MYQWDYFHKHDFNRMLDKLTISECKKTVTDMFVKLKLFDVEKGVLDNLSPRNMWDVLPELDNIFLRFVTTKEKKNQLINNRDKFLNFLSVTKIFGKENLGEDELSKSQKQIIEICNFGNHQICEEDDFALCMSDLKLRFFYYWYNKNNFNKKSLKDKKYIQLLTEKFIELEIFDIEFDDIENIYVKFSEESINMAVELPFLFFAIDDYFKKALFLNYPNILTFLYSILEINSRYNNRGVFSNYIGLDEIMNEALENNVFDVNGIKNFEFVKKIIKLKLKNNNFEGEFLGEIDECTDKIIDKIDIKEEEKQRADELIDEIIKLSMKKNIKGNFISVLSYTNLVGLLKHASSDYVRMNLISKIIQYDSFSLSFIYDDLFKTIEDIDERIEFYNKMKKRQSLKGERFFDIERILPSDINNKKK